MNFEYKLKKEILLTNQMLIVLLTKSPDKKCPQIQHRDVFSNEYTKVTVYKFIIIIVIINTKIRVIETRYHMFMNIPFRK